jgi:hypothetical protein
MRSAVGISDLKAGEDVKIPIAAMYTRATTMVQYIIAPASDEEYGF